MRLEPARQGVTRIPSHMSTGFCPDPSRPRGGWRVRVGNNRHYSRRFLRVWRLDCSLDVCNNVDDMRRPPPPATDAKSAALRAAGALHPRPDAVQDAAFSSHEFFDRRDRVQVKYEMLRRHRVDERSVTGVAGSFGVSRQAFYKAEAAFRAQGIPGLLPRPRGPKRAHKCSDEILDFVEAWRAAQPPEGPESVV
jgi:hypothetical protein